MTTKIYVLKCPNTNEIKYVGKTNNPEQRLKAHNNKTRDLGTHKRNWINKLREEKKKPIFEIIEEVPIELWQEKEKYWIEYYINIGCKLVNNINSIGKGLTFGNKTSFNGSNARPIIALDKTGEFFASFNSIKEAEEIIGKKGIESVLAKITKTAGNYIWLYEEDYYQLSLEEINNIILNANDNSLKGLKGKRFEEGHIAWNKGKKGKLKPDKHVFQYSGLTGELIKEWNTAKEAGVTLKINVEGIGQACRGTAKTAGGYCWSYNKLEKYIITYGNKANTLSIKNLK
jgi:predicted GIY-YIG superfamily endonuclease